MSRAESLESGKPNTRTESICSLKSIRKTAIDGRSKKIARVKE
ncbi:hypothetical protein LEP1GSC019_0331 [Leptospira interrogans serovar Pyrogenes str. 2006006960]|nr:hypothetical protein LEP1GSC019_0331 [Leptospira interrogans serovar Pyrogenes str. 2006006960]